MLFSEELWSVLNHEDGIILTLMPRQGTHFVRCVSPPLPLAPHFIFILVYRFTIFDIYDTYLFIKVKTLTRTNRDNHCKIIEERVYATLVLNEKVSLVELGQKYLHIFLGKK